MSICSQTLPRYQLQNTSLKFLQNRGDQSVLSLLLYRDGLDKTFFCHNNTLENVGSSMLAQKSVFCSLLPNSISYDEPQAFLVGERIGKWWVDSGRPGFWLLYHIWQYPNESSSRAWRNFTISCLFIVVTFAYLQI